jgi:hypothetical protein
MTKLIHAYCVNCRHKITWIDRPAVPHAEAWECPLCGYANVRYNRLKKAKRTQES